MVLLVRYNATYFLLFVTSEFFKISDMNTDRAFDLQPLGVCMFVRTGVLLSLSLALSFYNKFGFLSYCFLSYFFPFFIFINNLAQDDARPVDEREMDNKLKATSVPVHRSSGGLEDVCASNFKRESLTLQWCPCPACHCGHNTWGKVLLATTRTCRKMTFLCAKSCRSVQEPRVHVFTVARDDDSRHTDGNSC